MDLVEVHQQVCPDRPIPMLEPGYADAAAVVAATVVIVGVIGRREVEEGVAEIVEVLMRWLLPDLASPRVGYERAAWMMLDGGQEAIQQRLMRKERWTVIGSNTKILGDLCDDVALPVPVVALVRARVVADGGSDEKRQR